MNKRLLTQTTHMVNFHEQLWKIVMMSIFITFCTSSQLFAQGPTYDQTECSCLDNASMPGDGQFLESVTILSGPGENWNIVSADGFFDVNSPEPPAAPTEYPFGTVVPETSPGEYTIEGRRVENTNYTITFSSGGQEFVYSSTGLICTYPDATILGDAGICVDGDTETYSVDIDPSRIVSIDWDLPSGGMIVSGDGTNTIEVDWDDATGSHTLSVTGEAQAFDGQMDEFCDFDNSVEVFISDEESPTLACNNSVNLSINNSCELLVTADIFLEDMMLNEDSYEIQITDMEADTIVNGNVIGMEYIGVELQVSVLHTCSGNSCWGTLTVEDRNMPDLECPDDVTVDCDESFDPEDIGFPVPPTATVTPDPERENTYNVSGFDGCSDVTLFYSDVIESNLCNGPFGSTIMRTWRAEDTSGNVDTCSHQIFVNRGTLMDIMFPENFDDAQGPNPSIYACAVFDTLDNGAPDPSFTGMPTGTFCLNVSVTFEDQILEVCGDNSFKVLRRFSVTDLCDEEPPINHTQTITVMDNLAPELEMPENFTAGTNTQTCTADIDVPPVVVIEECSDFDYTVSYKVKDDSGDPYANTTTDGVVRLPNGNYRILEAEGDVIVIVYTVTDDCDNQSQTFVEATIVDDEQPVTVCDINTFIGLSEDGVAFANVDAFDDGSYDNCELATLEVRRMESSACGELSVFGEEVKFCCTDVGNTVMVRLRATDASGNQNECMVEVQVQDNKGPVFTTCPADVTVDCESNLSNLSIFGAAVAIDNCGVVVEESSTETFTNCGSGTIVRTFTATDPEGNQEVCTQTITVTSLSPFNMNNIRFPNDYTTNNGCQGSGIAPEMLPSGFDVPAITADPCAQIAVDYEDIVFQFVDGYCFKVLRTWTVFDECQFDPNVPGSGEFTDVQVIKVSNNVAPTFVAGCDESEVSPADDCQANLSVTVQAQDDCDQQDLAYTYAVDVDDDGTVDFSGFSNTFTRTVPYGSHRVTFTVTDECDNTSTCTQVVEVSDDKAPTPYCLGEVVTTINDNGEAEIWASDFDNGSFDNCIGNDNVIIAFDAAGTQLARTYTCDSLTSAITLKEVMIWVIDNDGNSDFCTSTLKLQDNFGYCEFDEEEDPIGLKAEVRGNIYTEEQLDINEVEVMIMEMATESPNYDMTDEIGTYAFQNLAMYNDYYVEPNRATSYTEGVSTLDLVLIQRHILGIQELDSPYKIIAADINNSTSVSAADIVQLRKLVLGIYDELPNNNSWRFVDAEQTFVDPSYPFPFSEKVEIDQLEQDEEGVNFIGVKIGDVNSSYESNATYNGDTEVRNAYEITTDEMAIVPGEVVTITLKASNEISTNGLQLSLDFDTDNLAYVGTTGGSTLSLTDNNLGLTDISNGMIHISIDAAQAVTLDAGDEIVSLSFLASEKAMISEVINLNRRALTPEIYTDNNGQISTEDLVLTIENRNGTISPSINFELMQNVPNPFDNNTTISFMLPQASAASLKVYDYTGRLLLERQDEFQKGYNQITLDINDIEATGILYYQLDTKTHSASRKMIVIR